MTLTYELASAYVRGTLTDDQVTAIEQDLYALQDALQDVVLSIEEQLAARKAEAGTFHSKCLDSGDDGRTEWFHFKNDYEEWRSKAVGFKRHVDRTLRDVKRKIRERHDEGRQQDLWEAIRDHFEASKAADLEPDPHDIALWKAAGFPVVEVVGT